jgi:hypothetical protein
MDCGVFITLLKFCGFIDELQYLFQGFYGAPSHNDPNKQEAYELSKNFVKLFVSFARDK